MPRPLVPDRRARILDAAERTVLAEGFDAMNVAAIARAAGIGKGAVYLEFAAKQDRGPRSAPSTGPRRPHCSATSS